MTYKRTIKHLVFGALIAMVLLGLTRKGIAGPEEYRRYYTAIVPIDLTNFLRSNNWYIRNFPRRLQGIADNEVFNAFQRLGEVRQIHLWPATPYK